jgi:ATP-binding cassette subfamily B (MDR/TAP) protein 1
MHAALQLSEIELDPKVAQQIASSDARMKALLQIRALHAAACEKEIDAYIDPQTGYRVFTAFCLRRTRCCGNECRHCPHGHRNVPR